MHVNQGEALPPSRSDDPLLVRDAAVFLHQALSSPVGNWIERAEGAYIYDGQGRAYLDLHGNGVHTVGYHNPFVVEAMQRQLADGLCFSPRRYTNRPAVELAEKLASLAPGDLNRVLFCPGGSQAIEMAIMLAKLQTGRYKTLSFRGTFHGSGFQAVSVGADPHFAEGVGPLVPGALHLDLPDYIRNPWGFEDQVAIDDACLAQLDAVLGEHPDIAAFVSEPVFYNSTVPSRYYWQQVRQRCDAYGILLIFDEIYTALGRTGTFFAAEQFVEPDMLVVGKGFGGGMLPFAGIIVRESLNQQGHKSIGHFTHEKNPLCSAVALAAIEYVEDAHLIERTRKLSTRFRSGLVALQAISPLVGAVSGLGLNLAVDIVRGPNSLERHPEAARFLMQYAQQQGIAFKLIQGNMLNLKPALVVTESEIDRVVEVLREGLLNL